MIVFNNIVHGFKIAAAIPRNYNPSHDVVISKVTSEGNCLGGVIYSDMISNCIFMHQAGFGPSWLSGDMIWVVFDYPFNQLNVDKVAGTIPASNKALYEFNRRMGFVEECRIKDAYKDGDLVVMTMHRDQCRWLSRKPKTIKSNVT